MSCEKPGPEASSASSEVLTEGCRRKLIVVIDDDALVLESTSGLLRSWNYCVVSANSVVAAVIALGDRLPDLIISDYRLSGGKTGIEVVAALRHSWRTPIPTLLITGDTVPEHLRELCASGHHLLHKPVTASTLQSLLNQLLGR